MHTIISSHFKTCCYLWFGSLILIYHKTVNILFLYLCFATLLTFRFYYRFSYIFLYIIFMDNTKTLIILDFLDTYIATHYLNKPSPNHHPSGTHTHITKHYAKSWFELTSGTKSVSHLTQQHLFQICYTWLKVEPHSFSHGSMTHFINSIKNQG